MLLGEIGDDALSGDGGGDRLYGGWGRDILDGGDGDDSLRGEAGNDTLTGGAGNDSFVMQSGGGHDIITDFELGADRVHLGSFGYGGFGDLDLADDGLGGSVLSLADGGSVTFSSVLSGALGADDFIF